MEHYAKFEVLTRKTDAALGVPSEENECSIQPYAGTGTRDVLSGSRVSHAVCRMEARMPSLSGPLLELVPIISQPGGHHAQAHQTLRRQSCVES